MKRFLALLALGALLSGCLAQTEDEWSDAVEDINDITLAETEEPPESQEGGDLDSGRGSHTGGAIFGQTVSCERIIHGEVWLFGCLGPAEIFVSASYEIGTTRGFLEILEAEDILPELVRPGMGAYLHLDPGPSPEAGTVTLTFRFDNGATATQTFPIR